MPTAKTKGDIEAAFHTHLNATATIIVRQRADTFIARCPGTPGTSSSTSMAKFAALRHAAKILGVPEAHIDMVETRPGVYLTSKHVVALTIRFEDHGQDFLEWDLDAQGKVIDCRPFQGFVWCKSTVRNHRELMVGGPVKIITGHGEKLTLNYPVERLTKGGK